MAGRVLRRRAGSRGLISITVTKCVYEKPTGAYLALPIDPPEHFFSSQDIPDPGRPYGIRPERPHRGLRVEDGLDEVKRRDGADTGEDDAGGH